MSNKWIKEPGNYKSSDKCKHKVLSLFWSFLMTQTNNWLCKTNKEYFMIFLTMKIYNQSCYLKQEEVKWKHIFIDSYTWTNIQSDKLKIHTENPKASAKNKAKAQLKYQEWRLNGISIIIYSAK